VMAMLEKPQQALGQIFNVGNPSNEATIADLAHTMVRIYKELRPEMKNENFTIENVSSREFYGEGYEDSDRRVPDITKAAVLLGWKPETSLEQALRSTIKAYIDTYAGMSAAA